MEFTDNNVLLKNRPKRSSFDLSHTLKTSSRFGAVQPVLNKFTLANDTFEVSHNMHVEFKPLRDKLNTQVDLHLRTYWTAISDVWLGAKQTFAINKDIYNNIRLPEKEYLKKDNDTAKIPFVRRKDVFLYLLASLPVGNTEHQLSTSLGLNHTQQTDWVYNYVKPNSGGLPVRYDAQSSNNVVTSGFSYLMPRICKNGCDNGFNFYTYTDSNINSTVTTIFCTRPEAINTLCRNYPQLASYINCLVIRCAQINPNQAWFWLDFEYTSDQIHYKLPSRVLSTSNHAFLVTNTSRGVPSITKGSLSGQGVTEYNNTLMTINDLIDSIMVGLFFDSDLLGKGSLAESLGVPFFFYEEHTSPFFYLTGKYRLPSQENYRTYVAQTAPSQKVHIWRPCFDQVDGGLNLVNYLPFLCYQKVISEHYLLPHECLPARTPEVDSPYFGSLASATYINCQSSAESDVLRYSISQEGYLRATGLTANDYQYNYYLRTNQLLNSLFSVAPLIATDYFTRGWFTANHGADQMTAPSSILTQSSTLNDTLHFYANMVAKKLGFLKRVIGQGLTYEQWCNSVFSVDGVESENERSQYVGGDVRTIATQTVMNTELADDTDPLGKKATVAEDQFNDMAHCAFYCKEYGFLLTLSHLSVQNEYTQVISYEMSDALAGRDKNELDLMLNPVFGDTGDDGKYLGGSGYVSHVDNSNPTSNPIVSFDNKNFGLKDAPSVLRGDYTDLYSSQVIRPTEYDGYSTLELTYNFLQKNKTSYNNVFCDTYNDNILFDDFIICKKKSTMPKLNNIGLI